MPISFSDLGGGGGGAGGNGFSLIVGESGETTYTFSSPQPAGAYSFTSELGDTSFDIYLVTADNQNAGYANASSALFATAEFTRAVIYGATSNDIINFDYKPAASPATSGDVDGGAAPFVTSATPSALPSIDDTTTITGGNFASNVEVVFTGQDAVERPAKNIVRSSSTSLIVTRPDVFPFEQEPFSVQATNPGIPSSSVIVNKLTNQVLVGTFDALVVAGGGGGGFSLGGGGGAGGYRTLTQQLLQFDTPFTVTVGAGGSGSTGSGIIATKGTNSTFGTITSTGGGFGGNGDSNGGPGGSGGGAGSGRSGGTGNQGGFTPTEGFNGGSGWSHGGGGGGAGGNGQNSDLNGDANGLNGGVGKQWVNGNFYAGGGGSGARSDPGNTRLGGVGGNGGGGNGGSTFNNPPAQHGASKTGGGGGGGANRAGTTFPAANGGSGVVALRYPADFTITIGAGLTGSTAVDGLFKVTTITAGTGNVSWAA